MTGSSTRKTRKAGEKTRQKLRDIGISPGISEKPNLTVDEANAAISMVRQAARKAEHATYIAAFRQPPADCIVLDSEDCDADEEGQIEVVGESHYRDALAKAFRARQWSDTVATTWATIVREPNNKYDENAVAVHINGAKVGHLPSDLAEYVCEALDNLARPVACRARIFSRDGSCFGVYLLINEEDILEAAAVRARPASQAPRPQSSGTGATSGYLQRILAAKQGALAVVPRTSPAEPPTSAGHLDGKSCLILLGVLVAVPVGIVAIAISVQFAKLAWEWLASWFV